MCHLQPGRTSSTESINKYLHYCENVWIFRNFCSLGQCPHLMALLTSLVIKSFTKIGISLQHDIKILFFVFLLLQSLRTSMHIMLKTGKRSLIVPINHHQNLLDIPNDPFILSQNIIKCKASLLANCWRKSTFHGTILPKLSPTSKTTVRIAFFSNPDTKRLVMWGEILAIAWSFVFVDTTGETPLALYGYRWFRSHPAVNWAENIFLIILRLFFVGMINVDFYQTFINTTSSRLQRRRF